MNEYTHNEQLKREVMTRVRTVYRIRQITKPLVIEIALLVASLVAVSFMVSIPNIVANLSLLPAWYQYGFYLTQAFFQTQFAVQLSVVAMTVIFILLVRDIVRNLRYTLSLKAA